jgi:hypothetical protein
VRVAFLLRVRVAFTTKPNFTKWFTRRGQQDSFTSQYKTCDIPTYPPPLILLNGPVRCHGHNLRSTVTVHPFSFFLIFTHRHSRPS